MHVDYLQRKIFHVECWEFWLLYDGVTVIKGNLIPEMQDHDKWRILILIRSKLDGIYEGCSK